LYVSSNPDDGAPFLVHPMPTASDAMQDFFAAPYDETANYSSVQAYTDVDNGKYAIKGHATEDPVAWDWKDHKVLYADDVRVLGTYSTVTMVKTPMRKESPDYVGLSASGHQFGLGSCNWIRHCTTSEKVGEECSADLGSVTFDGFCFESSTGTTECGALTEKRDKWGQNQVLIDQPSAGRHSDTQYACPHKAPVVSRGEQEVNRMLIAGCMITTDASYSYLAEVHVPQMCTTPADYMKGCLFPRATNYDMSAFQSDTCYFNTQGCTNSLAINYNIEANVDDGSCIVAIKGCTMNSQYSGGVATDTPEYDSSFVGKPTRFASETTTTGQGLGMVGGEVAFPTGTTLMTTVNNYNSDANVLEGCVLTVEGCMDSTALNYDSYANINSNTWCVPVVAGCMMPSSYAGTFGWNPQTSEGYTRKHFKDGLAINFDPAATLNDDTCVVEREGCTDSTMYNYDSKATLPSQCWPDVFGCLHPGALNYGCPDRFLSDGGSYLLTPCTDATTGLVVAAAKHDIGVCNFDYPPPSPPPAEVSGDTELFVEVALVVEGSVGDYPTSVTDTMCADISAAGGIVSTGCTTTVTAASVNLAFALQVATVAAQNAGVANLQTVMGSKELASGILGVAVLTLPQITAVFVNPSSDDNVPVIVGATVGGFFGALLLVGGFIFMKRKQSKVEA